MRTRLGSMLAMVVMLAAMLFPNTTFAVNPDACTETDTVPSYGFIWDRTTGQLGTHFHGVRMNVVARALEPCTGGYNDGKRGKAFILATFAGNINTIPHVQHLGLMKTNMVDQTYFGWTANGVPSSTPVNRVTWFDGDNDGTPDNPVGGRTYLFTISRHQYQAQGSVGYQTRFCIKDTFLNDTDCAYVPYRNGYTGSAGWSGTVWWACESGGAGSNVGSGNGTTNRLYIQEAGYLRADNGGVWSYTQDSDVIDGNDGGLWGPAPANQFFGHDQNGGAQNTDRVWCWGT